MNFKANDVTWDIQVVEHKLREIDHCPVRHMGCPDHIGNNDVPMSSSSMGDRGEGDVEQGPKRPKM